MNFDEKMKQELCQELAVPDVVDEKLQEVYQHILSEQKKTTKRASAKRRSRKRTAWIGAAAAVGMVVITGSVLYSQPALARNLPIIGNLFEKVQNIQKESGNFKDHTAYEQIEKHSEKVETPGNIAADNGVEVAVSDVYYDGYDLYYTISVRTEDTELNDSDYLTLLNYVEGDDIPFTASVMINGAGAYGSTILQPRKSADGSFVQLARISLDAYDIPASDLLDASLEFNAIGATRQADLVSYDSGVREWMGHKTIRGDWKLAFQANMDQSGNRKLISPAEDQGFTLTDAAASPSNLHLTILVPPGWDINTHSLVPLIFDSNGERVQQEYITHPVDEATGQDCLQVTAEATEMSEFVLKIVDKSTSSGDNLDVVAEIPFALQ